MSAIMNGDATPAQISALLVGLTMKGERLWKSRACQDDEGECRSAVEKLHGRVRHVRNGYIDPARSIFRRRLRWRRQSACGLPSTAIERCRASAEARTFTRRSANVAAPPSVVERSLDHVGIAFFFAPTFTRR
jgi:hypothetical protein